MPDFRADVDLGNGGEEVTGWLIQTEVGTTRVPAGISPALGQVCAQCLSLGQVTNPHPVRLPPTSLSLSAFLEAASHWGRTCSASGLFGVWSQEAGGEAEREGGGEEASEDARRGRSPRVHMALSWDPWCPPWAVSGPSTRGHVEWRGASGTSAPAALPACRVHAEACRGQGSRHGWPAGATLARENFTQQWRGRCEGGALEQPSPPIPSGRLSWGVGKTPVLAASGGFSLLIRRAPSSLPGPEERTF